jgi:hypothetical protein
MDTKLAYEIFIIPKKRRAVPLGVKFASNPNAEVLVALFTVIK